jgi:hypothetical protein
VHCVRFYQNFTKKFWLKVWLNVWLNIWLMVRLKVWLKLWSAKICKFNCTRTTYRVPHGKVDILNWLWWVEICKSDLVWRWFGNPEIWEFYALQPVFVKSLLCALFAQILSDFCLILFYSEPIGMVNYLERQPTWSCQHNVWFLLQFYKFPRLLKIS